MRVNVNCVAPGKTAGTNTDLTYDFCMLVFTHLLNNAALSLKVKRSANIHDSYKLFFIPGYIVLLDDWIRTVHKQYSLEVKVHVFY